MSADSIVIGCPGCGKQFKGPAKLVGRTVKCPACKTPIRVEAPEPVAVPADDGGGWQAEPASPWEAPAAPAAASDNPFDNPYPEDPFAAANASAYDAGGHAATPPVHDPYAQLPGGEGPGVVGYTPPPPPAYAPQGGYAYAAPPPPPQMYAGGTVYNPAMAARAAKPSRGGGGLGKLIPGAIGLAVLIAVIAGGVSAISSWNAANEKKVVGTWRVVRVDGAPFEAPPDAPPGAKFIWTFTADNMMTLKFVGGGRTIPAGSGSWSVSGKTMKFTLIGTELGARRQSEATRLDRVDATTMRFKDDDGTTMDLERE